MIAFWNRKEVYAGYSLNALNKARDILDANKIKYTYKYGNIESDNTMNGGQCYVYVHKNDYDNASCLLRDIWKE